jgi:hypothetical protein
MQGREGKTAASDIGKLRPPVIMSCLSWATNTGSKSWRPSQRSQGPGARPTCSSDGHQVEDRDDSRTQHSSSTGDACSSLIGQHTSSHESMQTLSTNNSGTGRVSELHTHGSVTEAHDLRSGADQSRVARRPTGKTLCSVVMLKVRGLNQLLPWRPWCQEMTAAS